MTYGESMVLGAYTGIGVRSNRVLWRKRWGDRANKDETGLMGNEMFRACGVCGGLSGFLSPVSLERLR